MVCAVDHFATLDFLCSAAAKAMHGLVFRAITTARCVTLVILFAALRCAMGWRGGSTRVRSSPMSSAARGHHPSRELCAAPSRRRYSPLPSAAGRSSHICRRRRGRLRDGSGGPRIYDWSLSVSKSPTLSNSHCKVATSVGTDANAEGVQQTGDVLVLALGGGGDGEGHRHCPPSRRNRRQRRRQRLRLQGLGEAGVEITEEEEEEEAMSISGVESNIVEAGILDIDAAVGQKLGVGAAVATAAGSDGSDASGARAANGESGSAPGPSSVADSSLGACRQPREVARSSPPVPHAVQEAGWQRCAGSNTEQGRSSALIDGLQEEDDRFMRMALRLAERARTEGEVPIGAVLTETVARAGDGKRRVLATGRNQVENRRDASAHAEMLCLQAAAKARRNWRLAGATLYVTMEPCAMCLSAAQLFRVDRIVFGAPNPNLGACGGRVDLSAQKHAFHDLEVTGGVLAEECAAPLRRFFNSRRRERKAASAGGGGNCSPSPGGVSVGGGAPQAAR